MQLSSAFKPGTFKPLVFVANAPQNLLKPKPAARFGAVGNISTISSKPQLSSIGATVGSAFSPSGGSQPRHPKLSERLAGTIPCKANDETQEDPEIAHVFALLSLSTSPASGREHQRSAPLPRTLEQTEQRLILKARSRRWRHGQSTPGRKRLSSCPGSISPTRSMSGKIQAPPSPVESVTETAPIAKKTCNINLSNFEPEVPTPCNSPSSELSVRQATPFDYLARACNFLVSETEIKENRVFTMDL